MPRCLKAEVPGFQVLQSAFAGGPLLLRFSKVQKRSIARNSEAALTYARLLLILLQGRAFIS
jgi:hypothetical protein